MKKILLSASMALVAGSAFAVTDGQTYEVKNGLTCENVWVCDRIHDADNYTKLTIAAYGARTCTTDGKVIYVGLSGEVGTIEKFDVATGEYLGSIALKKLNAEGAEEALTGTLCVNQVGFDDYGHFFVAPMVANSDGMATYTIYTVDLATGLMAVAAELSFDGTAGRVDYCDVTGDLTCTEAPCSVIANTAINLGICWWTCEKGSTEWVGAAEGLCWLDIAETYPADQAAFGGCSVAKFIKDGSGLLNLFYVDGMNTYPAVYANDGSLVDSFKEADLITKDADGNVTGGKVEYHVQAANGIVEGVIGSKNILAYAKDEYTAPQACRASIVGVDSENSFASIDPYWDIPADGLGQTSNIGHRIHCLNVIPLEADANGKEAINLVTFKSFNGLGVYRIAEEGYQPQGGIANTTIAKANIAVNGDVITVSEKANIAVYNVAGQKVAEVKNATEVKAPAAGLYVVKAGNAVAKVVVK